jgi:3-phenylpropionate/trans-cinnamate dioxygenase ferredoxin subunit
MASPSWVLAIEKYRPSDVFPEPGIPFIIQLEGQEIAVLRIPNGLIAYRPQCPHEGFSLRKVRPDAEGFLECPLHRFRFDLSDGLELGGRGRLACFPVKETDTGIYVAIG